jgi:uncharacterized membrane protein
VDQVLGYLGLALYYGLLAAFLVCFVMLLGYLLLHKQWLFAFLSIFFAVLFKPAGPLILLGPLIALAVGWQEAGNWKIKKLMRIYSALYVVCFILLTRTAYVDYTTPAPKLDPKSQAKQKAAARARH